MSNPLKAWRNERNLTQVQLGELLGVDGMTVSRWERGDYLPRKKHWSKIAEKTGISPADLINNVRIAGASQ